MTVTVTVVYDDNVEGRMTAATTSDENDNVDDDDDEFDDKWRCSLG